MLRKMGMVGLGFLLLSFCQVSLAAEGAEPLQALLLKFQSLQAHFVETMVIQGNKQVSSGEVAIQRPNKFRWVTTQPTQELFVSDSKKLWQYEADLDQVTVRPIDSHTATYSPLMLLSGEVSQLSTLYKITALGGGSFQLIPNSNDSLITSMTITFSQGVLSQLQLTNTMNQTTTMVFSNVVMNQSIDPKLFHFVPPVSADVLGG
jgi:outer membrane lipoprotein carrier protein